MNVDPNENKDAQRPDATSIASRLYASERQASLSRARADLEVEDVDEATAEAAIAKNLVEEKDF